ncbi:TonB-dependent receptor plug domain-containing protein [Bacteroidota bacterium]
MNRAIYICLFDIFVFFCPVCICENATAQIDTANISFLEMSLEELLNIEVVSASKISEKTSDAPASIHLITENQIKTRGYTNLEEVLEDIPGIEIQKKASVEYSNYFTIRGIDGSEKFIIMMDGMRINSPTGTPLAIVYNYPVINAKQIEIVLGPASALYGVDAFTGVINIITKSGTDGEGVMFSGSYGNYNTTNNSFMAGIGNEEIAFVMTGNFYFSDEPYFPDIYKDEYRWYNENYKTNGEMLVSPWDNSIVSLPVQKYETPTTSYALHAKLNVKDFEVGYFRNFESHSSSLSTLPEYTIYSKDASFKFLVESFYSSYNYESKNEKWKMLTTLSHCRDEIDPRSLYSNTYTSYIKGYKYAFNRSLKLGEQVTYLFSDVNSLIAGISYEDITALAKTGDMPFAFDRNLAADFQNVYYLGTNILDQDGNDLTIPQDFYYLQYQNLGTYIQWRTLLANKISLTLGGRLDYNTRYRSTLNPRAGLVYSPTNKLKVKVLFGRAYLSPSPYRQYQHYGSFQPVVDSVSQGVTGLRSDFWRLPGDKLESQKISTYETGFSYIFKSNLILTINGFINDVDDILSSQISADSTFKGIPVSIIERPSNRGTALSYGGTAMINFKNNWQNFTLNSSLAYTYIDGEIDGRQIPFTARNTVKAAIDFDYYALSASARFIYRSQSFHRSLTDNSGNLMSSDPYGIINLSARYVIVDGQKFGTELFVKINNLLNSRYYNVPVGGAESIRMTPQDPIRILLGVQVQFR